MYLNYLLRKYERSTLSELGERAIWNPGCWFDRTEIFKIGWLFRIMVKETVLIRFNRQKVFLGVKKHVLGVSIKCELFWSFLEPDLARSGSNLAWSRRSLKNARYLSMWFCFTCIISKAVTQHGILVQHCWSGYLKTSQKIFSSHILSANVRTDLTLLFTKNGWWAWQLSKERVCN